MVIMLKRSQPIRYLSMILVTLGTVSMGYAADFFTIIGPDGRPLVIPRDPVAVKQPSPSKSTAQAVIQKQDSNVLPKSVIDEPPQLKVVEPQPQVVPTQSDKPRTPVDTKTVQAPVNTQSLAKQPAQVELQPIKKQSNKKSEVKSVISAQNVIPKVQPAVKAESKDISSLQATHQVQVKPQSPTQQTTDANQHIVELDGEKYVDSEYLEDKEFNLEGKKRFYVMPEGIVDARLGAVRMQPEQREKGVSKSFVQSILKKNENQKEHEVLALSSTYYRLPKEQVVENLETACFSGKKIKEAKLFNVQKQIGLWPRKPLKDTFDYDVVKLSAPLKQLKLTSYATSDQQPTFYWPFVVFLDKNGCILEGVSGYKNQEYSATMLQHAAIEGTIRLPDQTSYILLTPLASALDVQEKSLSNQGQIKLTAIR